MPDIEAEYRLQVRRALLMQVAALEDLMIAKGELKERSVVPRAKREYNERGTLTRVPEYS